MINSWNGRNNVDELQHLKGDRHYIILIPNPDDETNSLLIFLKDRLMMIILMLQMLWLKV